jgi:hypothetical protein
MAMNLMVLDGYTFEQNPDRVLEPVTQKPVAILRTYSGSAVFQWVPLLQGFTVEMFWETMPGTMWDAMHAKYLSPDIVTWDSGLPNHSDYYVIVLAMVGELPAHPELFDTGWRLNVKVILNIRGTV